MWAGGRGWVRRRGPGCHSAPPPPPYAVALPAACPMAHHTTGQWCDALRPAAPSLKGRGLGPGPGAVPVVRGALCPGHVDVAGGASAAALKLVARRTGPGCACSRAGLRGDTREGRRCRLQRGLHTEYQQQPAGLPWSSPPPDARAHTHAFTDAHARAHSEHA